jgi:hypothetical protein
MSPFDQELVEFCQQRMIQRAQAAQLSRQMRTTRTSLPQHLMMYAGDLLISLGLKLKDLSKPASDHEYTPLYT